MKEVIRIRWQERQRYDLDRERGLERERERVEGLEREVCRLKRELEEKDIFF